MPSSASSVPRSHCCSFSSCSVAAATLSASPWRTVARTETTASGAFSAISSASARAASRKFVLIDELIGKADLQRFLAAQPPAGEEHQIGGLRADEARQRHGETEARVNAELREVRRETRFRRHDAKIRHEREAESAADRGSLDRANHRLLAAEQTDGFAIQLAGGVAEPFLCKIRASRPVAPTASEIRPRTERFALGRQHDGPALRVFVHCRKCVRDLADQTEVEEVVRRTLDLDGGDVSVERDADVGERWVLAWLRPLMRVG